jgi:hypothetical protein
MPEPEPTPFIDLPVAYRVMAVEEVRRRLWTVAEKAGCSMPPYEPLSLEAEAWLRRMRSAYCDSETTQASVLQMDKAMVEALPEAEAKELRRRLLEFVVLRDAIPLEATSTKEAFPAVLERLLELSELVAT